MKNRIKFLSVILAFVMMFSVIADVLPLIASEQTISETTEETSYQDTNNDLQEEQIPEQETHSGQHEDLELNESYTYQEVSEEDASNDFTEDEIETTTEEEEVVNDDVDNNENPDFDDNTTEETITVDDANSEENPDLSTEQPDETNGWELGLVFYDSTVNNGKTPLTEIDWDASDGGCEEGEPRVITIQINYKNTNIDRDYEPGELKISIPNLAYGTNHNTSTSAYWDTNIIVGANDKNHTGYEWDFVTSETPSANNKKYIFVNANTIEEKANFEGNVQISYEITPRKEPDTLIEKYEDECNRTLSKTLWAEISNIIKSNEVSLNYTRTYFHPWKYIKYKVNKIALKISSYDGLGENAHNYIWVKYRFHAVGNFIINSNYPDIYAKNGIFKDTNIPQDCIVYDVSEKLLNPDENGSYSIPVQNTDQYLYVGYPKDIYNEENNNLNITNKVELWGTYCNKTEEEFLSESSININLAEFLFNYSGDLYSIDKSRPIYTMRYQDIINQREKNNDTNWYIIPTCIYRGNTMTVKIGDDLLLSTTKNGEIEKISDDEYYFSEIVFNSDNFLNGNMEKIVEYKYDCELWVRYKNNNEHMLFDKFKNPNKKLNWKFKKEDGVVGFYFIIHDMKESLVSKSIVYPPFTAKTVFIKKDIPESGVLYNFDYIQVYFKDDTGNLIIQNEPGLDSYDNLITKEKIAKFDQETYNTYLQRGTSSQKWEYYNIEKKYVSVKAIKLAGDIVQNNIEENFSGTFSVGAILSGQDVTYNLDYKEQFDQTISIPGIRIYDLLPLGMEISSTEEEIKNSLRFGNSYYDGLIGYDLDFNELFEKDMKEISETEVNIINNWKNTGRTKLEIVLTFKKPIYISGTNSNYLNHLLYDYNFEISYNSYIEHGNIYKNKCSVHQFDEYKGNHNYNNQTKDLLDLDEDGFSDDPCADDETIITITSVVSTHQDVQASVKTDQSYYSTGSVQSSNDSEYEYKLRVRTGQNDVTNLVIYDSLEEYTKDNKGNFIAAHGDNKHWNGNLLGIDTSYAESKGYTIKTWYSENSQPDTLYNDNGNINPEWKEFERPVEPVYSNGLKIKFSNDSRTYNASDYVYIYYFKDGKYYRSPSIYGTSIAGKEIEVPSTDFYLYWHTSSTKRNYYGFAIDSIEPVVTNAAFTSTVSSLPNYEVTALNGTDYPESMHNPYNEGTTNQLWHYAGEKVILEDGYEITPLKDVKSFAFEYLDSEGNPAILPANSLTYVLIRMKSPVDESITSLAYNGCWTQWNALDEFDRPVDFVTGINSNIVKVALPNSHEVLPINLRFNKTVEGNFDRPLLDSEANWQFVLTLKNTGTGESISGIVSNKNSLDLNGILPGEYIIIEEETNWFDFKSLELLSSIEGITLKNENNSFILTISENADVGENAFIEFNLTNKTKDERYYDSIMDVRNYFAK